MTQGDRAKLPSDMSSSQPATLKIAQESPEEEHVSCE